MILFFRLLWNLLCENVHTAHRWYTIESPQWVVFSSLTLKILLVHTHTQYYGQNQFNFMFKQTGNHTLPLSSFFLELFWHILLQLNFLLRFIQPTNQQTIVCDEPKVFLKRTERCGPFNLHVMFQFRCMRPTGYVGVCFGFCCCCCFPFFNGLLFYACLVLSHLCSQTTHDNMQIIMGF